MTEMASEYEPLFLETSLLESDPMMPSTQQRTRFELKLLELLTQSPAARGLRFSQRLEIVDAMRQAGLIVLEQIENEKR